MAMNLARIEPFTPEMSNISVAYRCHVPLARLLSFLFLFTSPQSAMPARFDSYSLDRHTRLSDSVFEYFAAPMRLQLPAPRSSTCLVPRLRFRIVLPFRRRQTVMHLTGAHEIMYENDRNGCRI